MVRRTRAAVTLAVVAAVAAVGVAGCGSDDGDSGAAPTTTEAPATTAPPATTATTPAAPTTASVKVDADPSGQLAFVQKSLTAPAGADVFVLTNDSSVAHNLEIEGNGVEAGPSATVSGGEKAELKVTLKPGTYQFFCAIPGHREAGMEGTLTVQ